MHPGKKFLLVCSIPDAHDAGRQWKLYIDGKLLELILNSSLIEPVIYWLILPNVTPVWLLADKDYFLVIGLSNVSQNSLSVPFLMCCKVTVQIISNTTPTISHSELNITLKKT